MSDHDYLMEVHSAIYGVNGQGGLTREVHGLTLAIRGNPDALSFEDKQGISGTLRAHIRDDKTSKKRLWGILTLLVAAASAVSHYLLDLITKP